MADKQSRHKNYSDWRLSHAGEEIIDGKKETIIYTHVDKEGILDDIRKTPLNSKEHPRPKRGLPLGMVSKKK